MVKRKKAKIVNDVIKIERAIRQFRSEKSKLLGSLQERKEIMLVDG